MEMKGNIGTDVDDHEEEDFLPLQQSVNNHFSYRRNEFVVILTNDERCPFWTDCVHQINNNDEGIVLKQTIHWYQGMSNLSEGTYSQAFLTSERVNRKPWFGNVSADSIIVSFRSLRKRRTLPAEVHKKLRVGFTTQKL